MRITVNGGLGFIGSSLVPFLRAAGHEVFCFDNFFYGQSKAADIVGNCHRCDVNHPNELYEECIEKSDAVVNLAALVGAGVCDINPELAKETNVESVKWLVNKLRPEQLLLQMTTNSSYGSVKGVCTEETPTSPLTLYAETKEDAEKIVMQRKKSVSLRLATLFGVSPRMRLDLLVQDLTYQAFFNKRISLFEGDAWRNYVHVQDVCAGILHVMLNKNCHGEVFNLGNDKANCKKEDLIKILDDNMLFQLDYIDKKDPDRRNANVSSEKLRKAGFEASISVDAGVKELIRLFETFPPTVAERLIHTSTMRNA